MANRVSGFALSVGLVLVAAVVAVHTSTDGYFRDWLISLHRKAMTVHAPGAQIARVFAGKSEIAVPFQLVSGHVVIAVTVNNSRPLSFILDTGDAYATIDLGLAKRLGLVLGAPVAVKGVGPAQAAGAFVKDATFAVPGLTGFSQALSLAIPLDSLPPRLGCDVDGILGGDFIKAFVLGLDYQANTITLYNPDTFAYSGSGDSVPMRIDAQGHPVIDATLTAPGLSAITASFVLDIGSGGAVALNSPFTAAHHLPAAGSATTTGLGPAGTGGRAAGLTGRVTTLAIGRFVLGRPLAFFSQDTEGAFANADEAGSLGEAVLNRFKLILDYRHGRIVFEPASTFDDAFDEAVAGLVIEAEGSDYKTFRIVRVLEGLPGFAAGLRPSDVITEMDGRAASTLTLGELAEMLRHAAPHTVTARRGESTLRVTVMGRRVE